MTENINTKSILFYQQSAFTIHEYIHKKSIDPYERFNYIITKLHVEKESQRVPK